MAQRSRADCHYHQIRSSYSFLHCGTFAALYNSSSHWSLWSIGSCSSCNSTFSHSRPRRASHNCLLGARARSGLIRHPPRLSHTNHSRSASSSSGYTQIEKAVAKLKTPDPSPSKAFVGSDANDSPPSNENISKSKGLMGSLRMNKLRSISSIRSLRSPTKAKQPDTTTTPSANVGGLRDFFWGHY